MTDKSKIFWLSILVYIGIAILLLFSNAKQIPSGTELGGIILYLDAIFITFGIFIVTVIIMVITKQILPIGKNNIYIYIAILIIGLFFTNLKTRNVCINENQDLQSSQ